MKKYMLGLVSGIMFSICTAAIASDEVQAILFPDRIVVNGEVKPLEQDYSVLNYNGHLYLPALFVVELMGGRVFYDEAKKRLSIVDDRLSNRQDMLAMSKVLMESAKQGDLKKAGEIIDTYTREDRDRLFLSLTKYLFLYAGEPNMNELLQLFIAKGTNLEVRDEASSHTPLLILASQTPQYIHLLIKAGADVNAEDKNGITPLMTVAGRGMPEIVQDLLVHGANPKAKSHYGFTPLRAAVLPMFTNYRQETVDITKLLLAANADVNAIDDEGNSPLLVASVYASISKPVMLLLLEGGADVKTTDKNLRTALHYCVRGGDADLISKLIEHGVPVDSKDVEGNTPLYYAVSEMNNATNESEEEILQIIRLLIRTGANPKASNMLGISPVNQAVTLEDPDKKVKILKVLQEQP
ncbi:Ankyrin repeat-containing protein [Paenibacillus sp. 1_12]|uniref:ankyrin repeat domain-containing protein n=1 Tax=Paenibacillus sp. 1_12 TaxID=1566278 RepID=UPI0008E2C7BA|nr:ankyrin repeat domain-containing protein [Paenibacillus sp. 1_12]SFL59437.1 Ankyrin repeat-containing protein [Paenibacillus sp. 1_12]